MFASKMVVNHSTYAWSPINFYITSQSTNVKQTVYGVLIDLQGKNWFLFQHSLMEKSLDLSSKLAFISARGIFLIFPSFSYLI